MTVHLNWELVDCTLGGVVFTTRFAAPAGIYELVAPHDLEVADSVLLAEANGVVAYFPDLLGLPLLPTLRVALTGTATVRIHLWCVPAIGTELPAAVVERCQKEREAL